MASSPALLLLLPGTRAPVARPAPAAAGARAASLRSRQQRPARVRLVLAARTPLRPVPVCCAAKTGSFAGGPPPAPGGGVHGPALDALKSAAADACRPLLDNFNHVRSFKKITDANDYNIGMPFGVAIASLGCYQILKMAPWAFLDLVLGYLFYKLSVVSSELHREGVANDFITMIKAAIGVVMAIKVAHCSSNALGFIRIPILQLYFATFYCSMKGWKQDATYDLSKFFEMLEAKIGGTGMSCIDSYLTQMRNDA